MERFVVKDVAEIPKLGLKATRLQHNASGLQHIHVYRKDPNKVFSLGFKTNVNDSTGVPHILEHTTLCGSKKYPVRDPFFKMQTRSLANFMNAMTGFDYTFYPFATTNKADFFNLQKVYMDSVFDPLLKAEDFRQEGWRLEPSQDGDFEIKGVVFNEMKGNMSNPSYQFYMAWFRSIYESMGMSAGDPLHIPDLKYEDLVNFHRRNYTPSNCFTFSYGDMEIDEVLKPLLQYIEPTSKTEPAPSPRLPEIPQPYPLDKPVSVVKRGPIDQMYDANRQHKVSLTWYVGEPGDFGLAMVWKVLGILLTDGHAAPFYKTLIESGLGTEFSANTGFDEESPAKLMFTIGVQGIAAERLDEFKTAVFETLDKVIKEGFENSRVDGIVHQAELGNREVNAHYGMGALYKVMDRVFAGRSDKAISVLDSEKILNDFKSRIRQNPTIFQDLLSQMKEQPFFEFTLVPDEKYEENMALLEQDVLAKTVKPLTEQKKEQIKREAEELVASQQIPQNVDILPTVHVKDIPRESLKYPVKTFTVGPMNSELVHRQTNTQGISYLRLMRDASGISPTLLPYLSLYTDAVTKVGTKKRSMAELEDAVKLHTGGIAVGSSTRYWGGLELGYAATALDSKLGEMYSLLEEVATQTQLKDIAKLKQLLDANASNITNTLSQSGHSYALARAAAALESKGLVSDQLSGLPYVKLIQRLAALDEADLEKELVPHLENIHALPWSIRAAGLTESGAYGSSHSTALNQLLGNLNPQPFKGVVDSISSLVKDINEVSKYTHVPLPFQISHVGAAIKTPVSYTDFDAAALQVLSSLMTHKHLHTEIREKGGAYGGGASFNAMSGLLKFYSYRDPSPMNSVEVMGTAGQWAAEQEWTSRDVEEGLISIFQDLDTPISPRSEITTYLQRYTDEMRQTRRSNLLAVKPADLKRVAEQYLTSGLGSVCVVGPAAALQSEGNSAIDWDTFSL